MPRKTPDPYHCPTCGTETKGKHVKCEFCDEPNHDNGVHALAQLFEAVTGSTDAGWLQERAHLAWRNFRRAESISIPNDGALLVMWLEGLR